MNDQIFYFAGKLLVWLLVAVVFSVGFVQLFLMFVLPFLDSFIQPKNTNVDHMSDEEKRVLVAAMRKKWQK